MMGMYFTCETCGVRLQGESFHTCGVKISTSAPKLDRTYGGTDLGNIRVGSIEMTNYDELLARIEEPNPTAVYATQVATELAREKESYILNAFQKVGINPNVVIEQDALITELKAQIRAVVELIQEKQKFLENTKGDIPMTNQQLGAREERAKLLDEFKQAIEKELK